MEITELAEKQKAMQVQMEATIKSLEGSLATLSELPKHKEALEKRIEEMDKKLKESPTIEKLEEKLDEKVRSLGSGRKLRFGDEGGKELSFKSDMSRESFKEVFSLGRLMSSRLLGDRTLAKLEYEKLAMSEGTGSAGGFLVPDEFLRDVRDMITAQAVIRKAGATIYPMATDTLNIPTVTGGATANWLGENTTITAGDLTLAQKQLVAKKLAALVKVSVELLTDAQSNPRAEEVIRRDMAKRIALAEDLAFIEGTGASNQPTGILNTSGIGAVTLGANGGTPTFDTIYDALYEVEKGNGVASAWIMHPRTKNTLRKIKDTQNRYIYTVSPSIKEPDSLVGIPVHLTTQIPITLTVGTSTDTSYILVGQMDEAIIGEKGAMEVDVDKSGTAFETYQAWIRAIMRMDFILRTPSVFAKVTGVRP